jgi:hypothetical protein
MATDEKRAEYRRELDAAIEEIDNGNPMFRPDDDGDIDPDAPDGDGPDFSEAERLAHEAEAPKVVRPIRNRPLTQKQLAFVTGVIQGLSYRAAYRAAYPDDRSADHVVSASASKLLKHPVVAQMLEEAWSETVEALADDAAATKRYVLRQLLALSKTAKQEASRLRALEMMAKSVGMFSQQEAPETAAPTADQLKKELAGHLRLLDGTSKR